MNLGEMRAALLENCYDRSQDFLSSVVANRYVNMAAQHISNWADSLRQGLFLVNGTAYTVVDGQTGDLTLDLDALASVFRPFRRLVAVRRQNYEGRDRDLDVVSIEGRDSFQVTAAQALPKCYRFGGKLVLQWPAAMNIIVDYAQSLPAMTSDNDTPGQTSSGNGEANVLPAEYHHIVVSYASVLALLALNRLAAAQAWAGIHGQEREALLQSLGLDQRRGKA